MSTNLPPLPTVDTKTTQIQSQLTTLLSSSDNSASDRLQNLTLVHQARLTRLKRAAATLNKQPRADPAQVKSAEDAVTTATSTVARIQVLGRQITTSSPKIAAAGWALQGRVFDANLQPVPGFSVFLVDAQKAYQSQYGFSYVDSTGYFLLTFEGAPTTSQAGGLVTTPTEITNSRLFIEIANDKGQPVYLSTTTFQPSLGVATYTNITLPAGGQPIGDPPDAIRKVALPTLQKNS